MTFPYLKVKITAVRAFYIDVPYEKTTVFNQICCKSAKRTETFLEDITEKKITEEAVENAVTNSRKSGGTF